MMVFYPPPGLGKDIEDLEEENERLWEFVQICAEPQVPLEVRHLALELLEDKENGNNF